MKFLSCQFLKNALKFERKSDIDELDQIHETQKELVIRNAKLLRERLETEGRIDGYEKMQLPKPDVDAEFINDKIEQLWSFVEEDRKKYCSGVKAL